MKIETLQTTTLIPYARNTRTHSEAQIAQIAGSIREFGFTNPILIDAENGIIAGHGRVMAAQKLGLDKVPCIRLGHLTDTQRRAYIIADNKLALNAGWDEEMLGIELADLREEDFDLGLIGFSEDEIGAFDVEEGEMPALPEGDKQPFQQMTFTVHDEQAEDVQAAMAKAKSMGHGESAVNENSNGNALAFICQSFNRA
ncbi:ParB/Sulfiredoxin [uncultured Caudovirales phage]|uniref:ParB/Sulfiredoxin n=1 Tax=uncultured Caudovirales phage TaxID=2100421 RepID=A0A6J5N5I0_9CAUD|nr:ParB/Sulfiredoxin [uncultured Caudovirales phage]